MDIDHEFFQFGLSKDIPQLKEATRAVFFLFIFCGRKILQPRLKNRKGIDIDKIPARIITAGGFLFLSFFLQFPTLKLGNTSQTDIA